MKKINIARQSLLVIAISASPQLFAQQKPEYFKQMPTYNWIDDSHYYSIQNIQGESKKIIVDVKTGKEEVVSFSRAATKFVVKENKNGTTILAGENGVKDTLTNVKNVQFSPDSTQLAYTRNNDLYVYAVNTKQETRLTNDGSDVIYNGWSSWVYNEEILGRGTNYRAFWWSPDSKQIAFMHFDDSKVPVYDTFDDEGVHGKHIAIRYPQAGDPNPEVKVGVVNVSTKSTVWADFDPKADQYFGEPFWTPNSSSLWLQWMNRRQDTLKVEALDLATGKHHNIYTESQKTWISLDQENRITFVPSKNMFLLMSDKSGWMHIYAYDIAGKLKKQLTNGNWTVSEINFIDDKKGCIYFTAHKENSTRNDLYKVKLDGSGFQRLTFGDFTHNITLSPSASYFITAYSNYATPGKTALVDCNGKIIKELADSKGKDFDKYAAVQRKSEIIRVPTADGFDLPVRITWPQKIDTTKKYPLMAHIYGGPNFSEVQDGFYVPGLGDDNNDLIRVLMDHRGSGQFGKAGQDYLYRQLGKWEIEDFTTVIKYLEKNYPFIDSSRVGISGFSYGGYITCLALAKAPDVFKFGLAGGSVTDWQLYDTHYTERYMGTPKDNPEGYKQANVMTYVKNYKGLLRLTQGTVDDNVHMQNTMQLVSALQNASKHFELMFYPGGHHSWLNLHEKYSHYRKEDQLFIDKYLLLKDQKPDPIAAN